MDQPLPVQSRSPREISADRVRASAGLSVAIGIVLFNNSATELADLARTLHRAIVRLVNIESQKNPSSSVAISILLHNNGDVPVDATLFGPQARLAASASNIGFGRAHNLRMVEAFSNDAEFYVAANPDGMFHPDALVELIAVARRCEGRALVEASLFPEELPKVFDPLTLDTPWASGCCLLIPAAIHAAIGGFDENIFMYCEDVDLSWRARAAGFAVKHAPRALFNHSFKRPESNPVGRKAYLDAARYLATKWSNSSFERKIEALLTAKGWEVKAVPPSLPIRPKSSVIDFHHELDFAPKRWECPEAIPSHSVSRHTDCDNTIDVVVRFHDPEQIHRLSRCLFSLYGQRQQPIQILLMLQGLDAAGISAVDACVDAFDWAAPRRRPIVTNVAVDSAGDHRAKLWNTALDVSRARYVAFCDYDDIVYSAGYSYLLHRLQTSGAAVAFASALHVDCTPMYGFDYILAKREIQGRDRYDFFVSSFCPVNCRLVDRSQLSSRDLYVAESLSKNEDHLAYAAIIAKAETDWAGVGTPVAEYMHRTDGTNTVISHRSDAASIREWKQSNKDTQRVIASLAAKVPVGDLIHMRFVERELRRQILDMERSPSWRITRPIRDLEKLSRVIWRRFNKAVRHTPK